MVSKEAGKCALTNSELDPEAATSLALRVRCPLEAGQQVRKRNKALQVRFKDICEAQNEQRTAAVVGRPGTYAVAYRKYMTVPARRSIPNVTRSTGVQTSPDLRRRYQTFPFERKKGHGGKHAGDGLIGRDGGEAKVKVDMPTRLTTQALLHTTQCVATVEHHPRGNCSDTLPLGCAEQTHDFAMPASTPDYQICNLQSQPEPPSTSPSAPKVTGPIAWNSLTQVECLESPSAHSKRKKGLHLNGLQPGCHARPQCHARTLVPPTGCHQVVPVSQDGDLKAQLQAMETLISSSQETIKVLLGVIQELEKGEAHREGLSYRTGQDTANCDTCRNSACIIYSVELDFKQQEDKLQPLMRKLCPLDDGQLPSLPYTQDVFTSTPKRKSKTESKKHGRWKLWFL